MERRQFLKALAVVPFAPALLRGMDWAAPTPAEAAARGQAGYSCEVPPGTILPYVGPEAPPGFLLCDGREIPVWAYPKLYEALGTAYGGRTYMRFGFVRQRFRVPDLRVNSRPAAAIRADRHAVEYGRPPLHTTPQFAYVIKS